MIFYSENGLLGKAMQYVKDGDLPRGILELNKFRALSSAAAALHLARLERLLNDRYQECGYYDELLQEAVKNGHLLAKFIDSNMKWKKKRYFLHKFMERARILFKYKFPLNSDYVEYRRIELGKMTAEIARTKRIWTGQVECADINEPDEEKSVLLIAFRASSKEEFEGAVDFFIRRQGFKDVSIDWSAELSYTYETETITKDEFEYINQELGTPDNLNRQHAILE